MLAEMAVVCAIAALFIVALYARKRPGSWLGVKAHSINERLGKGDNIDWLQFIPPPIVFPLFVVSIVVVIISYVAMLAGAGVWAFVVSIPLFIAWLLSGWYNIGQGDVAAYKVFGKAVFDLQPGPTLAPPGIASISIAVSSTLHFVFGVMTDKQGAIIPNKQGDDQSIITTDTPLRVQFAGWDKAKHLVPKPTAFDHTGKVRVWTKVGVDKWSEKDDEGNLIVDEDPLQKQLTASPVVAVLLRINSMSRFERAAGSIENAFGNISRIVEGVLNQFAGKNTLRFCMFHGDKVVDVLKRQAEWAVGDPDALARYKHDLDESGYLLPDSTRRDELMSRYKKRTSVDFRILHEPGGEYDEHGLKYTDSWGVDIEAVTIPYWGTAYSLNQEQQNRAIAIFKKQSAIEGSTAEAEAIRLMGKAEADKAKALKDSGDPEMSRYVAALNASVNMMAKSNAIITTAEGMPNLMATGMAVGQQLSDFQVKKGGGDKDKGTETNEEKNKPPQGGGKKGHKK